MKLRPMQIHLEARRICQGYHAGTPPLYPYSRSRLATRPQIRRSTTRLTSHACTSRACTEPHRKHPLALHGGVHMQDLGDARQELSIYLGPSPEWRGPNGSREETCASEAVSTEVARKYINAKAYVLKGHWVSIMPLTQLITENSRSYGSLRPL